MKELNKLRAHLAQLTSERRAISDQLSALRSRDTELCKIAEQANTALATHAYHLQEEAGLKAKRDGAKHERAKLAQEIQAAEREERALSERERDYRRNLAQAEYTASTAADMQADMDAAVADVRDADAHLAQLTSERAGLKAKREQADREGDAVHSAEGELANARDSLEQQKAQAFIAGRDSDLAPYSARIAKAEKRLTEAKRNADAGLAALPIIAKRLNTITDAMGDTQQSREAGVKRYWLAYTWLFEIKWRQQVDALIETAQTLRALDNKTGRLVGHRLHESLREGLRVPMTDGNDYPQPIKLIEGDAGALLKRLESELETALLAEAEETD